MNQFTHVARRLVAGAVVALAMTVGLTTFTVAGSSAAVTSSKSVVGKSDLGQITSTVTGKTSAGDKVAGSFTPIRVIQRDGVMYVKGFLNGVIKDAGPNTTFSGVQNIPVKKINGSPLAAGRVAANASACNILNLVLGPLDLNILGLRIQLNQVKLDITAVPGAGNLLGNLLCAVAGLLDGTPLAGLLGQLQALLNQILGALNLGV
jgi:hypothetical protein